MATYGLKTYKPDGTTVVLQNSAKSAVFGQVYKLNKTGTAGTVTVKSFTEYTGRTIRPVQLRAGGHRWTYSIVSNVPTITFSETDNAGAFTADFYYDQTVLYIFVK